jgi:hypothetical protein
LEEENNTDANQLNHSSTSSRSSFSSPAAKEQEELTQEDKDRIVFKQYLYDKCQEVIATRE